MVEATSRIVPGAPPPTPITKSQKKKRKAGKGKGSAEPDSPAVVPDATAANVLDQASGGSDVKEDTVSPQVAAPPSVNEGPQSAVEDDVGYKPSPVVDLVHKRLKAIHKKIVSILSPLIMTCPRAPSIVSVILSN
jgi:hypothetical protein